MESSLCSRWLPFPRNPQLLASLLFNTQGCLANFLPFQKLGPGGKGRPPAMHTQPQAPPYQDHRQQVVGTAPHNRRSSLPSLAQDPNGLKTQPGSPMLQLLAADFKRLGWGLGVQGSPSAAQTQPNHPQTPSWEGMGGGGGSQQVGSLAPLPQPPDSCIKKLHQGLPCWLFNTLGTRDRGERSAPCCKAPCPPVAG